MKKILLSLTCFVLLIGLSGGVSAQPTVGWEREYDSGYSDRAEGVAVDLNGNVYVAGYSAGVFSISGYGDFRTIKYDPNGNIVWNKIYNSGIGITDYAHGIAVDQLGNVYVTGETYPPSVGSNDVLTIKYDSNGNIAWARTYDGADSGYWADSGNDIAVDSSGNIYVAGSSCCAPYEDFRIVKYDANGNIIWNVTYNSGYDDRAEGVAVGPSGNVYVTGWSSTYSGPVARTIKYDASGNIIWVQAYGPWAMGYDVTMDSKENIYLTGDKYTTGTGDDYLVIKYNSSGNLIWDVVSDFTPYDGAKSIAVDSVGNSYVTGQCWGGICNQGGFNTVKYNPSGNLVWYIIYDTEWDERAEGVAVDGVGHIYVAGWKYYNLIYDSNYVTIKYSEFGVGATVDIDPDTLNLNSKGKWITAYIELPEGYYVEDIDCSTILLEGEIGAGSCDRPVESVVGDYDDDGIPDLMVKFDRSAVQEILEVGEEVEIIVTGELIDGSPFEGSDTIRVIDKGK